MWCVVADNGDEFWVYGPFEDHVEAVNTAGTLQLKYPEIEYSVADMLNKEFANGKE